MHRFADTPEPLHHGMRLFEFVGYDVLRQAEAADASDAATPVRPD